MNEVINGGADVNYVNPNSTNSTEPTTSTLMHSAPWGGPRCPRRRLWRIPARGACAFGRGMHPDRVARRGIREARRPARAHPSFRAARLR